MRWMKDSVIGKRARLGARLIGRAWMQNRGNPLVPKIRWCAATRQHVADVEFIARVTRSRPFAEYNLGSYPTQERAQEACEEYAAKLLSEENG